MNRSVFCTGWLHPTAGARRLKSATAAADLNVCVKEIMLPC
jgi:hypothetical protein